MIRKLIFMSALASSVMPIPASGSVWRPDRGNGTYRNPVLFADYSDPDAIRVGDDYWLVSSSFGHVPGLPVLHSRDLVNWEIAGHALPRLVPEPAFTQPQPGKGVWAPSIRHHAGKFWIYYPDPDFGLYLLTAENPRGPWSKPVLMRAGKGLIDPCPLWDDDGQLYLIHGWAKSRAGFSNVLTLLRLSPDGRSVNEDLGVVIDGHTLNGYSTLEGPKLYKRNGWYYIFAPAGGVKTGWQSVFRARSIRGPYEDRIVLAQGNTPINGPHQGALVDAPDGTSWFLHFQDRGAYGRIVHLQPVVWKDDWPVMGHDADDDGRGEPVLEFTKPAGERSASSPMFEPATTDEFDSPTLGLQWQWQANPRTDWYSLAERRGALRLFAQPAADENLYHAPNLLLQKLCAPTFVATTELEVEQLGDASAGLVIFGFDYAWVGVRDGRLVQVTVRDANQKPVTEMISGEKITGRVHLRVTVEDGGICRFSASADGKTFTTMGEPFTARPSVWVGAKMGLFAVGRAGVGDFDYFRVTGPGEK